MSNSIPEIILVTAYDRKLAIGKNNKLLWSIPEDMAHFKELTSGKHVLMGRKTWESLPERFRPLPNRTNIVITRQVDYNPSKAWKVMKPEHLRLMLGPRFDEPIYVIGGSEIYELFLPYASKIIATELNIDCSVHKPDAYFPDFKKDLTWAAETRKDLGVRNGPKAEVVTYVRS